MKRLPTLMFVLACCCVPALAGGKKQPVSDSAPSQAAQVWVARPDGSLSCGEKEGQSLEAGAQELENNGVRVFESVKGNDGKMHAAMCGIPTGKLNRFRILEADRAKAESLGMKAEG